MEDREILLAYYGYVYPGKGLETLLSTVYQVAAQKKDVGLLIIGGLPDQRVLDRAGRRDYLDELKSSAETLTISQRLRWIGYSPASSELPSRLLRACDMCVLPFDNGVMLNNSSFSFAAMHGMPIVSTYGQHTENVFVNGQNALLLPPCHAVQLAQAIIKLAEDVSMKQKLSAGALALANERFSWQATVNDTIRFWSSQKAKNILSIA
jgi:glycosyltransferase involved in cell wall biosynthesis